MGVIINQQNVNQMTNLFADFAKAEIAKGNEGAVAYLFPGHSTHLVMSLDKPIFAAMKHGGLRSDADRNVNNYVRDLLMGCVATKLKCKVDELPGIFKWAGVLQDLKVSDFGKGRPLTARRIDAILSAVTQIENKYKFENIGMDFALEQGIAHEQSVADMAREGLTEKELNALPTFKSGSFHKDMRAYTVDVRDSRTDRNIAFALEQESEEHATRVGTAAFSVDTHSEALENLKNTSKAGKIEFLRRVDKTFRAGEAKVEAAATKRYGKDDPRVGAAVHDFGARYLADWEKTRIHNHPLRADFIEARLKLPENQALDPQEARQKVEAEFKDWITQKHNITVADTGLYSRLHPLGMDNKGRVVERVFIDENGNGLDDEAIA